MSDPAEPQVDLAYLLKLRLVVGRCGEMDRFRWWNTQGMLGPRGAQVLRRGMPFTHSFAQARVVFAVARARCHEVFDPPGCMTLWRLPAELEDQFDDQWHQWLDDLDAWKPFFARVSDLPEGGVLEALSALDLIRDEHRDQVARFRRSADSRAVMLPGEYEADDEVITLLAASFARGEEGSLAVPYARLRP